MNKVSVSIFCMLSAVAGAVVALVMYLSVTYIDDTVVLGEAYGFVIGDSKSVAYSKAPQALTQIAGQQKVFYEIVSDGDISRVLGVRPGFNVMVEAVFHEEGFSMLENRERWRFFIGGSYFNVLVLEFCGERLCEIHRHRKYFEGP